MKKIFIPFIILCLLSISATSAFAKTFTKYGAITQTTYMPPNSPIKNFAYDLFYYIPAKLKGKTNLKTIIFLHGGGASTSDRAGSSRVAKMYINDLKTIADNLGVVLVSPSGSALNWGGHMINMLKGLTQTIRAELPVNPNKIALTGHSMGGMGITRSAHWLADDFAFFMPVAAGMDERHQTESNLSPYFNMTYHHLQGLNDHFKIFITRCKAQEKNILLLEKTFGKKTRFKVEYYNGSHNYPKRMYQTRLGELLKSEKRDFYQTDLNGLLYYRDEIRNDQWSNGYDYYLGPRDRYFWIKATEFAEKRKVARVEAQISNNKINITVGDAVSKLRVYLSNKNLDLKKSITITVNGATQFVGKADLSVNTSNERRKDAGFVFESFVDVNVN